MILFTPSIRLACSIKEADSNSRFQAPSSKFQVRRLELELGGKESAATSGIGAASVGKFASILHAESELLWSHEIGLRECSRLSCYASERISDRGGI